MHLEIELLLGRQFPESISAFKHLVEPDVHSIDEKTTNLE